MTNGYVIFFNRFSQGTASQIEDPSGRLRYDHNRHLWKLYWITGRRQWRYYDQYDKLHEALEVMFGDQAPHLFHKVL